MSVGWRALSVGPRGKRAVMISELLRLLDLIERYSGTGQLVVLIIALAYTWLQVRRSNSDRNLENIVAMSDRVMAHNTMVYATGEPYRVVAALEQLNDPAAQEGTSSYRAARAVHLGHVHLVWQAWELSGHPRPGKSLPKTLRGWERFARQIVVIPLSASFDTVTHDSASATPTDRAAHDLWEALRTFEIYGQQFFQWLESLSPRA